MMIRTWKESDFASVLLLEQECFPHPMTAAMLEREMRNQQAVYVVAEEENQILGYGGYWRVLDEAQIMNIAVFSSARRKHIGTAILSELIRKAKNESLQTMSLEVRESNQAAISLYQKQGFSECGKRNNYYSDNREAAILMMKVL